jgi:putative phosphoesterase
VKRIGIISDTHGVFDRPLVEFLSGVDEIWHAGDIGSLELADRIAALLPSQDASPASSDSSSPASGDGRRSAGATFKPLRAVYGNIDAAPTRREFPEIQLFECEGAKVLMTHIGGYAGRVEQRVAEIIATQRPHIFVFGHTHILKIFREKTFGTLCINPGAAGLRGIHRVRTAVRLTIDNGEVSGVEVGEWPR